MGEVYSAFLLAYAIFMTPGGGSLTVSARGVVRVLSWASARPVRADGFGRAVWGRADRAGTLRFAPDGRVQRAGLSGDRRGAVRAGFPIRSVPSPTAW